MENMKTGDVRKMSENMLLQFLWKEKIYFRGLRTSRECSIQKELSKVILYWYLLLVFRKVRGNNNLFCA